MSKFKVGDRVSNSRRGTGTVVQIEGGSPGLLVEYDNWTDGHQGNGFYKGSKSLKPRSCWFMYDEEVDLVTEGGDMPHQRRTFKQLKDSVMVKKDALWQEACDDGTQEYILLDQAFNKDRRQTQRIYDRSLVEDDTKNFVEVFKVSPEYMTREELDQFEAFKKAQKPARTRSTMVRRTTRAKKVKAA